MRLQPGTLDTAERNITAWTKPTIKRPPGKMSLSLTRNPLKHKRTGGSSRSKILKRAIINMRSWLGTGDGPCLGNPNKTSTKSDSTSKTDQTNTRDTCYEVLMLDGSEIAS